MSFKIYAIRIAGDVEARYIGQTQDSGDHRLHCLLNQARIMPRRTVFANWLVDNGARLVAVTLFTVETRAEARAIERQTVQCCLALNHRLFNQWLVPAEQRIDTNAAQGVAA